MPTLASRELLPGDIVISAKSNFISHAGIVAGTVQVTSGNSQTVARPGITHATTGGLFTNSGPDFVKKYGIPEVFRYIDIANVRIGARPAGEVIEATALSIMGRTSYGFGRAGLLSWTGTSSFGISAKGRLLKYLAKLKMNQHLHITNLYCSEFAVLCYQLACEGDEKSKIFIDLDGKHTLPKDLRNWLLNRCNPQGKWQLAGELTG